MSEDIQESTLEEQTFWLDCVRGLPGLEGFSGTGYDKEGYKIPFGTGSHSVKAFKETFELLKPKNVLEIGSNMFYATAVFLELAKKAFVLTTDISLKEETVIGAERMKERYGKRFTYFNRNDAEFYQELGRHKWDVVFIDGSHLKDDVITDIDLCLLFKIPYLLFDDTMQQFGEIYLALPLYTTQLELVKEWHNMALYKNKNL